MRKSSSCIKWFLGGFAAVIFFLTYLLGIQHVSKMIVSTAERIPQSKITNKAISGINGTSGLAVSREHRDVAYTHKKGDGNSLFFAVDVTTGELLATFEVEDIANYNWGDFAYGPCIDDCRKIGCSTVKIPSRYCIYIADIGDYGGNGAKNNVYMIREPRKIRDSSIKVVKTLMFKWTETDAKTLMISPGGKLYVISQSEGGHGVMVPLSNSAWGQGRVIIDMKNTATLKIETTQKGPISGDISPDGKDMIIVTKESAYYYNVPPNGDYVNVARSRVPEKLRLYEGKPSYDAVSWSTDGQGFYVMTEGKGQTIYYFPKVKVGL